MSTSLKCLDYLLYTDAIEPSRVIEEFCIIILQNKDVEIFKRIIHLLFEFAKSEIQSEELRCSLSKLIKGEMSFDHETMNRLMEEHPDESIFSERIMIGLFFSLLMLVILVGSTRALIRLLEKFRNLFMRRTKLSKLMIQQIYKFMLHAELKKDVRMSSMDWWRQEKISLPISVILSRIAVVVKQRSFREKCSNFYLSVYAACYSIARYAGDKPLQVNENDLPKGTERYEHLLRGVHEKDYSEYYDAVNFGLQHLDRDSFLEEMVKVIFTEKVEYFGKNVIENLLDAVQSLSVVENLKEFLRNVLMSREEFNMDEFKQLFAGCKEISTCKRILIVFFLLSVALMLFSWSRTCLKEFKKLFLHYRELIEKYHSILNSCIGKIIEMNENMTFREALRKKWEKLPAFGRYTFKLDWIRQDVDDSLPGVVAERCFGENCYICLVYLLYIKSQSKLSIDSTFIRDNAESTYTSILREYYCKDQ